MRGNHNLIRKFLLLPAAMGILLLPVLAYPAEAGGARCFMHGIITPPSAKKSLLSDMIRLHFDADDKKKCEEMMSAYCEYHVKEKEYSTARLKGSFKPDVEKTDETTYKFTDKCKLIKDPEDSE